MLQINVAQPEDVAINQLKNLKTNDSQHVSYPKIKYYGKVTYLKLQSFNSSDTLININFGL